MRDACVLDTQAWVIARVREEALPVRARRLIHRCTRLFIPEYSLYEVALLMARGRLPGADPAISPEKWLTAALRDPCELVAISPRIAARAVSLRREGFHRDPADGLIYATAESLGLPLVTGDKRIHAFEADLPRRSMRLAVWD